MSTGVPSPDAIGPESSAPADDLDVERDSDVPISTQIYWQITYQIDSGRLRPRLVARDRKQGEHTRSGGAAAR